MSTCRNLKKKYCLTFGMSPDDIRRKVSWGAGPVGWFRGMTKAQFAAAVAWCEPAPK